MKKRVMAMVLATSTAIGVGAQKDEVAYADEGQSKDFTMESKDRTISKGVIVNVQSSLRIRQSPDTNSKILGHLKNGQEISIMSKKGSWYEIKWGNIQGYIHGDYVKVKGTNENNTNTSTKKTGKVINVTSNLRIREKASTSSSVIGYMTNGQEFSILGKEGTWYKITFNNKTGYIHSDYVKEIGQTSQPPTSENKPEEKPNNTNKQPSKGKVINVTTNLRVRTGPGTSYGVAGSLKNNEEFNILSKQGNWYQIAKGSLKGYISADYVKITAYTGGTTEESKPTPPVKPPTEEKPTNPDTKPEEKPNTEKSKGKVINVTSSLRVRKGPGTTYEVVGSLKNNDEFDILSKQGTWYQIAKGNLKGYISADYVKVIEPGSESEGNKPTNPGTTPDTKPEEKPNEEKPNTKPEEANTVYTNYNMTMDEYARIQHERNPSYSIDYFKDYLNPNGNNKFQFLRLDKFRSINSSALNSYLEANDAGVLKGQANAFVSAARNKGIDPVYFVAQSIHETAYGKSTLAKGVEIKEIADLNAEIKNDKGELIGYKMIPLEKPVVVYNLYGVGAYDNSKVFPNRSLIAGTTYAYNKGWTTVAKAIEGAAEFVSSNYINSSKYEQNTLFKMRYMPNSQYIWHQYATSPWYAKSIGEQIQSMEHIYTDKNFLYDKPKFTEGKANPLNVVLNVNKNKMKQSEISLSIEDSTID